MEVARISVSYIFVSFHTPDPAVHFSWLMGSIVAWDDYGYGALSQATGPLHTYYIYVINVKIKVSLPIC
jgi:hypothetical protein